MSGGDFVVCQAEGLYQTYNFLEKRYFQAQEFVNLAGSIVYLALKKIPKCLGYFGIFDLLFVAPRMARSIRPLFTKSTVEEMIFTQLNTISEVNGVILQLTYAQELVHNTSTALLHKISTILYPVDLILTGREIYDLSKANALRMRLSAICKDGNHLEANCFIEQNRKALERSLAFPKHFVSVSDIKELEELCKYLKKRALFAVMTQVVQGVTTAFSLACYFPALSQLLLLGYSVSGIAHAALRITEKIVVKKNPLIFNGRHS